MFVAIKTIYKDTTNFVDMWHKSQKYHLFTLFRYREERSTQNKRWKDYRLTHEVLATA